MPKDIAIVPVVNEILAILCVFADFLCRRSSPAAQNVPSPGFLDDLIMF